MKNQSLSANIFNNAGKSMPEYHIRITKTAQKQLGKLSDSVANTIIEAIKILSFNPRPNGCKKLKGRSGYRIR